MALTSHADDAVGTVLRPVTNNRTGELDSPLDPGSVYHNIVLKYGRETGVSAEVNGLCVHSLRATATTNALSHEADIAGPGVARSCQRFHDSAVRPAQDTAGGQPDVQGQVLGRVRRPSTPARGRESAVRSAMSSPALLS